jgi:hypothetical protein
MKLNEMNCRLQNTELLAVKIMICTKLSPNVGVTQKVVDTAVQTDRSLLISLF